MFILCCLLGDVLRGGRYVGFIESYDVMSRNTVSSHRNVSLLNVGGS